MNLVLTHCWREWRAQWRLLASYLALGFLALCFVFLLLPDVWWADAGKRALALSWFVVVGGLGPLLFVAPGLVTSEFGAKGDQFVRRLPGALASSFGGKLLFLLLATAAMPLLGLVAGEAFLTANGQGWCDLFDHDYSGLVYPRWPWPMLALGFALLLTPWVWAHATWLPRGRMAIGGTVVTVLGLAMAVAPWLRRHPHVEEGMSWEAWLPWVPALGIASAAASWVFGRRAGGPARSARFGFGVTLLGLLPASVWFGAHLWRYQHPDPRQLTSLSVAAVTPDGRFAMVHGSAKSNFDRVPFRIDLQTGAATRIGGSGLFLRRGVFPSSWNSDPSSRYATALDKWSDRADARIYDAATGSFVSNSFDHDQWRTGLSAELTAAVRHEARARSRISTPGGIEVWIEDREVCVATATADVQRMPWPSTKPVALWAGGHGIHDRFGDTWFDVSTREFVPNTTGIRHGFLVRGTLIHTREGDTRDQESKWLRREPGAAESARIASLTYAHVLGLVDDDRLLCCRSATEQRDARLFFWHVERDVVQELTLAEELQRAWSWLVDGPGWAISSRLPRDSRDRIWLKVYPNRNAGSVFVAVDTVALRASLAVPAPPNARSQGLIAFEDGDLVLIQTDATIQRVHVATGQFEQVFPPQ
jgi:hypothetical protein